jgi:hypothetical protein
VKHSRSKDNYTFLFYNYFFKFSSIKLLTIHPAQFVAHLKTAQINPQTIVFKRATKPTLLSHAQKKEEEKLEYNTG